MKKYCVYITTNLIDGKQYVGDHATYNLNDRYLGSGQIIKQAVKKYKYENFKKVILEEFNTKQEAFEAQEKYIKKFNTLVPNGYNISPCGGIANSQSYITEEHKDAIRKAQTGRKYRKPWNKGIPSSEEQKIKNRNAHLGKKASKETKEKMSLNRSGEKNGMYGKKHSPEAIIKMQKPKTKK